MEPTIIVGRTLIDGQMREIHHRKEEHDLGQWNHANPNLWAKIENEWVPWLDIGATRPCYSININEGNEAKYKWTGTSISRRCNTLIYCNGIIVYELLTHTAEQALAQAQTTIAQMKQHDFTFDNPASQIGRKIWYREQPAVIESLILGQGCIMITQAEGEPFKLSRPWDCKDDIDNPWEGESTIKVDVLSHEIFWHRN